MRIGLNPPDPQGIASEQASSAVVGRTGKASTESTDSFSGDTLTLSTLAGRALQMPEVRQEKVASLQQSIAAGQYKIDAGSIAAAMLGE